MINWNDYFEHIIVLTRCSSFDRREKLDEQFKKLNITNYQYWYNFDEDFSGESKIFKKNENDILIGHQRTTFGHYTIWKTCYELKYNNVLIIEDDVKFIDDINIIQDMLNIYITTDYDIYMFDYMFNQYSTRENIIPGSNFRYENYLFATCYCVNNNGLKYLIKKHEASNLINDNYFYKFYNTENIIDWTIKYKFPDNPEYTNIYFDYDDLQIKLELSPIKICAQPDKIYD